MWQKSQNECARAEDLFTFELDDIKFTQLL